MPHATTATQTLHMPLNTIDHMPPPNYSNAIFYLPLKSGVDAKEAYEYLEHGLHAAFKQLPWLAGKVYPVSPSAPGYRPGQLEVRYQSIHDETTTSLHQLRFEELDTMMTYDDLRELAFHPEAFDDATLTWAPYMPDVTQGADVVVAQVNSLPGGLVITMATCHSTSDGVGTMNVARMWAHHCQQLYHNLGAELQPGPVGPDSSDHNLLERVCIAQEGDNQRPSEQYPSEAWRMLNLEPPTKVDEKCENETPAPLATPTATAPGRLMKSYVFYIPPAKVTSLREDCMKELKDSTTDLSINDVICALIWRSLLKSRLAARNAAHQQSESSDAPSYQGVNVRLDLPFDARPYMSHLVVPPDYMGNFTLMNQALLPLDYLIAPSTPIAQVARSIREAAGRITAERIMEAYALLRQLFQGGTPSMKLHSALAVDGTGLMITSLVAFPLAEVCFEAQESTPRFFGNSGRPETMRTLMGAVNQIFRYGAVLPRKSHGGVEFVVNAYEDELDILLDDEELGKYAIFVV